MILERSDISWYYNKYLLYFYVLQEIDGPALLLLDNDTIKNHLMPNYRNYEIQNISAFGGLIKRLRSKINGFLS